jgi:hypothetical protein
MDDSLLRLFGSGVGGSLDIVVVLSFIAFSFIFFLAPVLGYPADRRGLVLIALYLLLGYGVLVLLQLLIQYLIYLSSSGGTGRSMIHLGYIFGILRLVLFLGSMATFVFGLQNLRRSPSN